MAIRKESRRLGKESGHSESPDLAAERNPALREERQPRGKENGDPGRLKTVGIARQPPGKDETGFSSVPRIGVSSRGDIQGWNGGGFPRSRRDGTDLETLPQEVAPSRVSGGRRKPRP